MTAIGLLIYIIGHISGRLFPPSLSHWGVRDLICTLPEAIGLAMMCAGIIVFLYRTMP